VNKYISLLFHVEHVVFKGIEICYFHFCLRECIHCLKMILALVVPMMHKNNCHKILGHMGK
jgi:hypothetical protein